MASHADRPAVLQDRELPADADAGIKRKRGRPPNAARREAIDAPQAIAAQQYDADAETEGAVRPRKRGRPIRSTVTNGTTEEDGNDDNDQSRAVRLAPRGKENRPLHNKTDVLPAQAPVQDARRRRGRPALGTRGQQDEVPEGPAVNGAGRRRTQKETHETNGSGETSKARQPEAEGRRTRRERGHQEETAPEVESERNGEPEQSMRSRRRGRSSLKDHQRQEPVEEPQEEEEQPRLRRRRRPSLQEPAPPEDRDQASKTKTKTRTNTAKDVVEETSEPARRGRKGGKPKELTKEKPPEIPSQRKGRRPEKRQTEITTEPPEKDIQGRDDGDKDDGDGDDGDDDAPPSPEKPYTHIAPHVHRVRQSDIKAKWSPLNEPSLSSITSILHLAQRPILQRLSNTQQRREHTSAALRLVSNRITRKVARGLPFPPPAMMAAGKTAKAGRGVSARGDDARAAELDFESVLDAKQALERQLDPAMHAVDLLRREKERLERELERDYEVLRNLDTSARSQGRDYCALVRKAHALAPAPETASRRNEEHEKDGLVVLQPQASSGGLFDTLQEGEDDIREIGLQLGSHAESIRNNLRQTEGILPQLSRSRAALQGVLFRYLDQEQYEQVVFG